MKIDRRTFIKQIGAASALFCSLSVVAGNDRKVLDKILPKRIVSILHTNDVHSHIDPMPADHPEYANLGGYARRKAFIDSVRSQSDSTLVFECGDMFQGTPYFNFYKGKIEIELMNKMNVDAVTIGNHEFDNGVEMLSKRISEANFPFLNANYSFANETIRKQVKPYQIFERSGLKFGVFGLGVPLVGLVTEPQVGGTICLDTMSIASEISRKLKVDLECDVVILLSHLGLSMPSGIDDRNVAKQTHHIDIILGGHSHTFMPMPEIIKNASGRDVLINQVGYAGINVGQIDISISSDGNYAYEPHHSRIMA